MEGAEPRTLAAFAPEYVPVSSIKSRLGVDCFFFFFFAFSLHSRRRQSQEPWYSIAKEIPLPEKQGRFQPRERQSWSSGVILLI